MSTIRCHTVPQFYLNNFLPPGSSSFWVYDKKDSSVRQQTPVNTTVIGDYYLSSPDPDGKKDARMEEFLSFIEGMTKPILDKWLTKPDHIDVNDASMVALFLSFMHARAPRTVEAIKEMSMAGVDYAIGKMKEVAEDPERLRKQYEKFMQSPQAKDIKMTFEEFTEISKDPTKNCTIVINEKHAIGDSFNASETVYRALMSMYWSIRYITNDHFFITNDVPLNIFVQSGDGKAIFGGGLALPSVEVAFPLSPKVCLWMQRRNIAQCERVHADFVQEINRRAVYMAERFVVSPYRSNNILKIVKEFLPMYGKPKMDSDFIKQQLHQRKVDIPD